MSLVEKLCAFRSVPGAQDVMWELIRGTDAARTQEQPPNLSDMKTLVSQLAIARVDMEKLQAVALSDLVQLAKVFQLALQFTLWSQRVMRVEHQQQLAKLQERPTDGAKADSTRREVERNKKEWRRALHRVLEERDASVRRCVELEGTLRDTDLAMASLEKELRKERKRYTEAVAKNAQAEEHVTVLHQRVAKYEAESRKWSVIKAQQQQQHEIQQQRPMCCGGICGHCGHPAGPAPMMVYHFQKEGGTRHRHRCCCCHSHSDVHCRSQAQKSRHWPRRDPSISSSSTSAARHSITRQSTGPEEQRRRRRHRDPGVGAATDSRLLGTFSMSSSQQELPPSLLHGRVAREAQRPHRTGTAAPTSHSGNSTEHHQNADNDNLLPKEIKTTVDSLADDFHDQLEYVRQQNKRENLKVHSTVEKQTTSIHELHNAIQNLQSALLHGGAGVGATAAAASGVTLPSNSNTPRASGSPQEESTASTHRRMLATPPQHRPQQTPPPGSPNTLGVLDEMKRSILPPDVVPTSLTPPREDTEDKLTLVSESDSQSQPQPPRESLPPPPLARNGLARHPTSVSPPGSTSLTVSSSSKQPSPSPSAPDGLAPAIARTPKGLPPEPLRLLRQVPPLTESALLRKGEEQLHGVVRSGEVSGVMSGAPTIPSPTGVNTTGKPVSPSHETTSTILTQPSVMGAATGASSSSNLGRDAALAKLQKEAPPSPAISPRSWSRLEKQKDSSVSNTSLSDSWKKKAPKKPMPNFSVSSVLLSPTKNSNGSGSASNSKDGAPLPGSGRNSGSGIHAAKTRALSPPQPVTKPPSQLHGSSSAAKNVLDPPPLRPPPLDAGEHPHLEGQPPSEKITSTVQTKPSPNTSDVASARAVEEEMLHADSIPAPPKAPLRSFASLDDTPVSVKQRTGSEERAWSFQTDPPPAKKTGNASSHSFCTPPMPTSSKKSPPTKPSEEPSSSVSSNTRKPMLDELPASASVRRASSRDSSPSNDGPLGSNVSSPMEARRSLSVSFDDVALAAVKGTSVGMANSSLSQMKEAERPVAPKPEVSRGTSKSPTPPSDPTKATCRHCHEEVPKARRNIHESNCERRPVKCTVCHQRMTAQSLPTHECRPLEKKRAAAVVTEPSISGSETTGSGKKTATLSGKDDETRRPHSGRGSLNGSVNGSSDVRASSLMLQETQRELQALLEEEAAMEAKKRAVAAGM